MNKAYPLVCLSEVCEINIGRTPSRNVRDYWGIGFPWLSISDMNQGKNLIDTKEQITEIGIRDSNMKPVLKGTVLLSFKLSIGKVGIAGKSMFTNEAIAALPIIDTNRLIPEFLYWSLRSIDLNVGQDRAAMGLTLNKEKLKTLKIPLPPLPEQRRIAAILDQADALRAKRREALAQLDKLTQSIFIEMFGDPVTNPKGWEIVNLGTILDDLTDYHANGSYEILRNHVELLDSPDFALMLRTTDLENNNFSEGVKYITEAAYNFLKKSKVYGGEIVINKIGSAGCVYLAPVLNRPVSLGMNSFLLRVAKSANSRFIYDVLTTDYMGGMIRSKVRGAVTKTITKEAVRSIEIPLPPLEIQNDYAKHVFTIEKQKSIQSNSLTELDNLFASLQHRAFRGEL